MAEDTQDKTAAPDDLTTRLAVIRDHLARKDFKTAERLLRKLTKETGLSYDVCVAWADYCLAHDNPVTAAEYFQQALELQPTHSHVYDTLIEIYTKLNQTDKVEETLQRGAVESNKPLDFYIQLEFFYVKHGKLDEARRMFDDLRHRYAGQPELDYKLGEAASYIDLDFTAASHFTRALLAGCDQPFAYSMLATVMSRHGYSDGTMHFIRRAVASAPEEASRLKQAYEHLKWHDRTCDEMLLAALNWKIARAQANQMGLLQLDFLGLAPEKLEERFQAWLLPVELTPSQDIMHTAEFFRGILESASVITYEVDLKDLLQECAARLDVLGETTWATYHQAWLAVFRQIWDRARQLFELLLNSDNLPGTMVDGCRRAQDFIPSQVSIFDESVAPASPKAEGQSTPKIAPRKEKQRALQQLTRKVLPQIDGLEVVPTTGIDLLAEQVMDIWLGESKRSIILVGPSGVGKTALVRRLAARLDKSDCPDKLKEYALYQTSTAQLVAGAIYIGQWQERLAQLCEAAAFEQKAIIYFEDFANLTGAGRTTGDSSRFLDYLLPRMTDGEIVIITEMQQEQAQQLLRAEPHLHGAVTLLPVEEPDRVELAALLKNFAVAAGKPTMADEALAETITLADTFMPYRAFPGKALDLLKLARRQFAPAGPDRLFGRTEITKAFCVSTGIPASLVDMAVPLSADAVRQFFTERILGQDEAVESFIHTVMVFKARLCDQARPIRSFLFVGPTGVGKTEAAKVLAEYLFGTRDRLIRLDMSEYNTPSSVQRLLGGESGHPERSGPFLEAVREKPFSVVLLDEIEKADAEVLNLLLQLLDEGRLSDSTGKPVSFQSAIIIMTSNIGARHYQGQSIGFGDEHEQRNAQLAVMGEVKKFFPPEIFNRFDEVICFNPLARPVVSTLINRELGKVFERRGLVQRAISVDVDTLVKEFLLREGYEPKYGARHLKRAVEKHIAVPLGMLLAAGSAHEGDLIRINMQGDKPVAEVIPEMRMNADESARTKRLEASQLVIPDKEVAQFIKGARVRVEALKTRLDYSAISARHAEIKETMNHPGFWDCQPDANRVMQEYARLNRLLERIYHWEKLLDRLETTARLTVSRPTKANQVSQRSQLELLLKELESAELEVLLEGKNDSADAFVLIWANHCDDTHIKWMLELAAMYANWAKRRGYYTMTVGENPGGDGERSCVVLHIGGLNAFGLLKNERGIHRKTVPLAKPQRLRASAKPLVEQVECQVLVLADVQELKDSNGAFQQEVRRTCKSTKGWRIAQRSVQVTLQARKMDLSLHLLGGAALEKDKRLLGEMFLSYMHYHAHNRPSELRNAKDKWGTLVRTMTLDAGGQVVDHRTGIVIGKIKDYLGGKIDALLLERII